MTHKLYRDETDEGLEVIELDLPQEMIDWLEETAILNGITVDQVIEEALIKLLQDMGTDVE
jgi:23S rRNA G2069 N7-methylase RlmK/C1962 C5-methylase RlmI